MCIIIIAYVSLDLMESIEISKVAMECCFVMDILVSVHKSLQNTDRGTTIRVRRSATVVRVQNMTKMSMQGVVLCIRV